MYTRQQRINVLKPKNILNLLVFSFKTRCNKHIHSFMSNNNTQTTLYKHFKKVKENVKIQWTILHRTNNNMLLKLDNCSICNLERLVIAEADRNKTLSSMNELTTICQHNYLAIFEFYFY